MTESVTIGQAYRPEEVQPDPFGFYAQARRECPVFYSEALQAWAVNRYDDVRAILADQDAFSLSGVLRVMEVLSPEAKALLMQSFPPFPEGERPGDEARRRARLPVQRAFTAERVRELDGYLREVMARLVDRMVEAGPGDLMLSVGRPLPIWGKAKVLGLLEQDVAAVVEGGYCLSILSSAGSSLTPEFQLELARRIGPYQQLLDSYVRDRWRHPREDLFSELVKAVVPAGEDLTDSHRRTVVETMIALISAGQSTTTSMFGLAMWHLLSEPDRWRALAADPGLIAPAVEEMLRYDMPMQGLLRTATCPVSLRGQEIPAGGSVMLMFASANHDETVFPDPERIDLSRSPNRHLSFGHGARACVGMHLARRLLQLSISTLVQRVPDLRLVDDQQLQLWPGMHRLVRALPVTW